MFQPRLEFSAPGQTGWNFPYNLRRPLFLDHIVIRAAENSEIMFVVTRFRNVIEKKHVVFPSGWDSPCNRALTKLFNLKKSLTKTYWFMPKGASLGYVHTNTFSFGFVFGDIESASIDLRPHCRFHEEDTYTFSFGSTFESVFTLMRFRRKRSAS